MIIVGYGDIVLVLFVGKVVGGIVFICGIIILFMFVLVIGSIFLLYYNLV